MRYDAGALNQSSSGGRDGDQPSGLSMNSSWPAAQIMRLWYGPPARERQTMSELLRCPRKSGTRAEVVR
jgi:hypothetical protein